jgi:hypothetical protein
LERTHDLKQFFGTDICTRPKNELLQLQFGAHIKMATPVDKPTPTIEEIEQIKKKKLEKKLEKKRKREERRLAPGIVPTENPGSCNYFMPQKNRFCNIAPKPGTHVTFTSGAPDFY